MVVGILPQEDMSYANPYCDIIVPTGMGFSRSYVTAYSADSAIVVGGGAGTYVEALVAYQKGKPIVALTGTGGTADKIADSYLDDRKTVKVMAAPTPKDAVDQALDHALNGKRGIRYFRKNRKSVFIRIQNTSSDVGLQSQPPRLCPSCVKYFCQKHYGKHEECCPERLTRCSSLAGDMLEINTHLSTVLLSIGIQN